MLRLRTVCLFASAPLCCTLCATLPLNQACGSSTKRCCFIRYSFTSSHCSQVYLHSQMVSSFPSLLHVHPFFGLCFDSTVLLVLLFFLVVGRLHSFYPSPFCLFASPSRLASHPLTSRPPVLLANVCSSLPSSFFPVVSPCFPSPCEGLRIPSPEYIYSPSPLPFHCKFTHLPLVRTPLMPPSLRHERDHPFHHIQCSN